MKKVEKWCAWVLLISKPFLFFDLSFGWVLMILGDFLFGWISWKKKLFVSLLTQLAAVFLGAFGLWKWIKEDNSLFWGDYFVLTVTLVFAFVIVYFQRKNLESLWKLELKGTFSVLGAFYLLAIGDAFSFGFSATVWGWMTMLLGHYYYRVLSQIKELPMFAKLQLWSMWIAGVAIIWHAFFRRVLNSFLYCWMSVGSVMRIAISRLLSILFAEKFMLPSMRIRSSMSIVFVWR